MHQKHDTVAIGMPVSLKYISKVCRKSKDQVHYSNILKIQISLIKFLTLVMNKTHKIVYTFVVYFLREIGATLQLNNFMVMLAINISHIPYLN